MASSSSGDGPSTSGRRRRYEREQYWENIMPVVVTHTRASNKVLQELLYAAKLPDIIRARKAANNLKKLGMSPDKAVELEARDNPKSKRHGPLHVAAFKKHKKICSMLVEDYECEPNATDADGATPLYFATTEGSLSVVQYLLSQRADPNIANNSGITPLHQAASRGYCEIAECLLFKGANVDPICQDGEAPVHVAALSGHAKMVKLLSDHNANLDRLSGFHDTPLVYSLFGSSLECLQTFIQKGANIKANSRSTPLSVAARKGLADCIRCLLNKNADPNELNEDGKLPLELAASNGQKECFEILLRVTNPLPKYADLGVDEILQEELFVRFIEEYIAIRVGDIAFWEKDYTYALGCYNLASKLGHKDPSLYAKRSLCLRLNRNEYLDDAIYYRESVYPDSKPCSEEDAKQSLQEYFLEWKTHHYADEASREEHP